MLSEFVGFHAVERFLLLRHRRSAMDMNMIQLMKQYGDDEHCRKGLEHLRWPNGATCPRCKSPKLSHMYKRQQFDCDSCGYQFSVTSGTIFHDTHLPLQK